MKNELIVLLVLTLLLSPIASVALTPQVTQTADIIIDAQSPVVYAVIPYDHGLVLVMTYTNVTPTGRQAGLYVYFLNGTTMSLMYETPVSIVYDTYAFVQGGELYVAFCTSHTVGPQMDIVHLVEVLVFNGLRLVNSYVINGACLSYLDQVPLYKIPAVTITGGGGTTTVILNGSNITIRGLTPVAAFRLPEGILVALVNSPLIQDVVKNGPFPLNLTLYSYNGKIIWTRVYGFSRASLMSMLLGYSLDSQVPVQDYIALVGGQLFVFNTSSHIGALGGFRKINATIVGISLENGNITTIINASNMSINTFLLNIGDKLYVASEGENDLTVYEYNGKSLIQIAEIPLVTKAIPLPVLYSVESGNAFNVNDGNETLSNITSTIYSNATVVIPVSVFLYDPGSFFLVLNPVNNNTDVTDVYPGGVLQYSLNGKVLDSFVAYDVLPLNVSGDLSLVFLNANGTVRGTVDLGRVTASPYYGLGAHVVQVGPNEYYVVAEHSNSSGNEMIVYKVYLLPHSVERSTTTPVKIVIGTEVLQASSTPYPIAVVVGVAIVVAIIAFSLVLTRRK